jgi:hypothetical protein
MRRVVKIALAFIAAAGGQATADDADLDLGALIQPVPRSAVFQEEGFFTWCGSMVRGEDGRCYLFYSRWPYQHKMAGWVRFSEIACAVADSPMGPYRPHALAFKGRGGEFFDSGAVTNPHIHRFGKRYYLYYTGAGTKDAFEAARMTQRIGVATADSPLGPWQRADKPLIDVTPGSFDSRMVNNPSVAFFKGRYVIVYKAQGDDGKVLHGVAFADAPDGPFTKHGKPIFTHPTHPFPAEDPFIFSYHDRLYTILSDNAAFTGIKQALCLFQSGDGIDWKLAAKPLVSDRTIRWADGATETLGDLERPQLFFDGKGEPMILFCAATRGKRAPGTTFNIRIPLQKGIEGQLPATGGKPLERR